MAKDRHQNRLRKNPVALCLKTVKKLSLTSQALLICFLCAFAFAYGKKHFQYCQEPLTPADQIYFRSIGDQSNHDLSQFTKQFLFSIHSFFRLFVCLFIVLSVVQQINLFVKLSLNFINIDDCKNAQFKGCFLFGDTLPVIKKINLNACIYTGIRRCRCRC